MNKDPKEIGDLAMPTQEGSVYLYLAEGKSKYSNRSVFGVFRDSIWALTGAGEGGREGK